MLTTSEWYAIAAFIGVFAGTMLPYFRKRPGKWSHYYTLTAITAGLGAIATTWVSVREYAFDADGFIASVLYGFAMVGGLNELGKWLGIDKKYFGV